MSIRQSRQKSWAWTVLFCALCCLFTYRSHYQIDRAEGHDLEQRLMRLEQRKSEFSGDREELHSQIQSQSDPAWVEMVLMRELGVVPEGWLKIHFH